MSKIGTYYLLKQEKQLAEMQDIQNEIANAQDCHVPENTRWWKPENDNPDFIKHCEQLLNEQPF